jgi:glycosyltransferase involved in cell wall biosynthesis
LTRYLYRDPKRPVIRFSIVLPVRNGWPYVQDCVSSILAQTYPHFDLLVLDNQSTDNTVPWLKTVTDDRLRLQTSDAALSIVDSWGRITGVAKQEFMTIIGHDDMLDPGFLAAITNLIERHADAKLYQTGSRIIDSEGATISSCRPVPERETPEQYLEGRLTYQRDISGTGIVMRSADYDRLGGIPHFERLFFADDALWLSLMRGGYKAADAAELFSVRLHAKKESTSRPSAWPSFLLGLNQFSDFLQRYIEDDAGARAAADRHLTEFMLDYHRNIYIFALVEACQAGRKIDPAATEQIATSLAKCAPDAAGALKHSVKVRLVGALNAGFLRALVPHLWIAYQRFWIRSQ